MWRTAEASTYVKAPGSVVFSVLTAYDLYRTWIPDVIASRLFAREGDIAVAELICPPYGGNKFLLELIESPEHSIAFRRVDRDGLGLTGAWHLEEVDRGQSVVARASLKLNGPWYQIRAARAMRRVLARTVEALKERSLKVAAAHARGSEAAGELILDLNRVPDGLVVHLRDRVFELSEGVVDGEES